ncbi:MAG: single-stranded-DNA-specific exonuclease RecJ [Deltaproteobacteria bacterium]|nr:single-stranded-DNA-specific exonuclease RecJ [Deltaproteobacteria bacterium]
MTEKTWRLLSPLKNTENLTRETGISSIKARLLINRGIGNPHDINSFLSPKLSGLIEPMLLKDMEEGAAMVVSAIERQEKIAIFGDYDADGLTSTALLVNFFSELGIPVLYYIPDRITEGYGLNMDAVNRLAREKVNLIITVDCGISNKKEIEYARSLGISVVVTDHHQIPELFSPVCPVINPNRPDSEFPFRDLAGVGVAFFLAAGIRSFIRKKGWFKLASEPDLKQYLDIVAIGTIADMVPLTGQNRIMVMSGIETMKVSRWLGIEAMKKICGLENQSITSGDIAFKLAPRLNAAGRIGDNKTGIKALVTDNYSEAINTAKELNSMNTERQRIESKIVEDIETNLIPEIDLENKRILLLSKQDWHKGVLGIVASKLLERYHRPTVVLTIKNGMATGSGRSIDGFNLHESMTQLKHLFKKFGGHYHAAGCTLESDNIESLANGLEEIAQDVLRDEDLIPSILIDDCLKLEQLTIDSVNDIHSLEPFGSGNPEPVFYSGNLEVTGSWIVGENHLKLRLRQGETIHEAIGFNLGDMLPIQGSMINAVYCPEINKWNNNEKVQMRIIDLEPSGELSKLRTENRRLN